MKYQKIELFQKMGVIGSKEDIPIAEAFQVALEKSPTNTVVSVGSGFGVTEKELDEEFGTDIVTIDPLVERYKEPSDKTVAKLPMYRTVEEYIECVKYVECVEDVEDNTTNLTLLLDWPSPTDSTYAENAIEALEPEIIIVRYASCGAAGSNGLQSFLLSCNCPSSYSGKENPFDGLYKKVYHNQNVIGTGGGFEGMKLDVVVLVKI